MNILIVLLGCNILDILNDRVNTAVKFAINFQMKRENSNQGIIWFLSGGIKYNNVNDNINLENNNYENKNEAEKMMDGILREKDTIFDNMENTENVCVERNKFDNKWNFILDTNSTNTAENFIMVNQLLSYGNNTHDNNVERNTNKVFEFEHIYVITSTYHYKRAKLISDYVNKNNNYEWILSPLEERNSQHWENIHIKNAEKDVQESMKKFRLI
jgi:uncharacterized SAM-binding protein YcdF (DUF218 family)